MTTLDVRTRPAGLPPAFFALTIFASAGLVFLVQPMVAKFALPLLGGSPSVWNTSMVFFQAALLAGYGYAHALQRVKSLRTQAIVHGLLLLAAVAVLPLRVSALVGPPSSNHPALWLLAMLTVSVGPPFAMLSATAPLVQAWYARVFHARQGAEPYVLYAASNFGSLIALLGYPILVEPTLTLHVQSWSWSIGYGIFTALMIGLGLLSSRGGPLDAAPAEHAPHASASWRERLTWMSLAAIPSSLMLGVTTHITTDVASAPFLWVLPLALYLVTFIIAFQSKPAIPPTLTLSLQAAALLICTVVMPFKAGVFVVSLLVHLSAFFFTALMCHQALVARRPPPQQLTEFYLWMSIGGVVGGAFTALVAPVIFTNVWEYPLMLGLACLARPAWDEGRRVEAWRWALFILAVLAAVSAPIFDVVGLKLLPSLGKGRDVIVVVLMSIAVICGFLIRRHKMIFFGLVVLLLFVAQLASDRVDVRMSWRDFFGVVRQSETKAPALGGTVRMLSHGTTLHGAQAQDPRWRCRPLVYYAPETPIGQVFLDMRRRKPAIDIGAVGLGTGTVSAYVRAADRLTFYEIDPQVIRISTDPKHFSYTTECAKGRIDYVLGDARLSLAKAPPNAYDILLIDAFSSDAVPVHLLTTEAVKMYLRRLKPDGVLILHLSNRNLALDEPAAGVARAAGGYALMQHHLADPRNPILWESTEDAIIVARSPEALKDFAQDGRWKTPPEPKGRAWSDDYSNLITPLYKRLKTRWRWIP